MRESLHIWCHDSTRADHRAAAHREHQPPVRRVAAPATCCRREGLGQKPQRRDYFSAAAIALQPPGRERRRLKMRAFTHIIYLKKEALALARAKVFDAHRTKQQGLLQ